MSAWKSDKGFVNCYYIWIILFGKVMINHLQVDGLIGDTY